MIYSMTGYAAVAAELPSGALTLELRSVNHRYLDFQVRMPEDLRSLEPALREAVSAQMQRGKIECRINYAARGVSATTTKLNNELLNQLADWSRQVQTVMHDARGMSVSEVLRWEGMLESPSAAADELRNAVLALMHEAVSEFSAARAREGEKLKEFLLQRVAQIEAIRSAVVPRIPAAISAYEARLAARLREAVQSQDNDRLHQEVVLFATRIDVDEELSRLASHLAEVRRIVDQGGVVGKRLDFLMQELNREANTLGSKAVDAEVSRASMEIKLLIEQMREQIQNLE
ncbi:YicC/YloC family endoribonuclease [Ferriphaselus sp. R-1]|uniref:YicC/YloC family endoribonuclease n=1 Tax=Ferriphaselus sp. R-1 TaxID=1485544 RepID=UPI00054D449E|nr:YicC/YloC family endoribonuclease [Ferriphaselus sp. R-1]